MLQGNSVFKMEPSFPSHPKWTVRTVRRLAHPNSWIQKPHSEKWLILIGLKNNKYIIAVSQFATVNFKTAIKKVDCLYSRRVRETRTEWSRYVSVKFYYSSFNLRLYLRSSGNCGLFVFAPRCYPNFPLDNYLTCSHSLARSWEPDVKTVTFLMSI